MEILERGEHALRQAEKASKRGDLAVAERWVKVATQAALAAERLQAQPVDLEDDEAVREELKRRLARFCTFSQEVCNWEAEYEAWKLCAAHSRRTGAPAPPPMRPHPAGPSHHPDSHLTHLLQGPEPDDHINAEAVIARLNAGV